MFWIPRFVIPCCCTSTSRGTSSWTCDISKIFFCSCRLGPRVPTARSGGSSGADGETGEGGGWRPRLPPNLQLRALGPLDGLRERQPRRLAPHREPRAGRLAPLRSRRPWSPAWRSATPTSEAPGWLRSATRQSGTRCRSARRGGDWHLRHGHPSVRGRRKRRPRRRRSVIGTPTSRRRGGKRNTHQLQILTCKCRLTSDINAKKYIGLART